MTDSPMTEQLAHRAIERSVGERRTEYERETTRIVDATFGLIERTGNLDPSVREILAETGLSTQAFYRYFMSKDELMLALLDEGRRRLVTSLERRIAKASHPAAQIRAWIGGVLAQASNASAAARTRPWVMGEGRIGEVFPEQQQASVDLLVELLVDPIAKMKAADRPSDHPESQNGARALAVMIYRLTFATLRFHLTIGEKPTSAEIDDLVGFCVRGIKS